MEAKTKRSNFKITAIAVTEASQGGAASLMNDPLLLKSLKEGRQLSGDQKALLLDIGHKESEIDKALVSGKPSLSSSEENEGDDSIINKGTKMSEEILKELADLKRENAIIKAEKQVAPYSFGELETGVATALADLDADGVASITKAFKFLVDAGEAAVELEKATKPKVDEDNALAKSLDEEAGVTGGEDSKPSTEAEQKQADLAKALDEQYEKLEGGAK